MSIVNISYQIFISFFLLIITFDERLIHRFMELRIIFIVFFIAFIGSLFWLFSLFTSFFISILSSYPLIPTCSYVESFGFVIVILFNCHILRFIGTLVVFLSVFIELIIAFKSLSTSILCFFI